MPTMILTLSFTLLMASAASETQAAQAVPAASMQASIKATPTDAAAAQKSVRALINAIRYSKDDLAASKLGFEGMAKLLLADSWTEATPAQKQALVRDLGTLVTRTSFPKGRDLFGYLDALLFETATAQGDTMHVKSVVVVHRNLKKVELPIEWVLAQNPSHQWQVIDIISMNESTAAGIREEEVLPLLHEGGLPKVLAALAERATQVGGSRPAAGAQ